MNEPPQGGLGMKRSGEPSGDAKTFEEYLVPNRQVKLTPKRNSRGPICQNRRQHAA
jgi:hypothetical protein